MGFESFGRQPEAKKKERQHSAFMNAARALALVGGFVGGLTQASLSEQSSLSYRLLHDPTIKPSENIEDRRSMPAIMRDLVTVSPYAWTHPMHDREHAFVHNPYTTLDAWRERDVTMIGPVFDTQYWRGTLPETLRDQTVVPPSAAHE